jgi:hypothetical protein
MTIDWPLDYPGLIREALRTVVRDVLWRVAEEGLPGEHHFYISFATMDPGVEVPAFLRDQYPEEATIVLQHQFEDLEVDDEAFSVSLRFGGSPQRVRVPFESVKSFVDPEAKLGLRFDPEAPDDTPAPTGGAGNGSDKVVSLDAFRSKKNG